MHSFLLKLIQMSKYFFKQIMCKYNSLKLFKDFNFQTLLGKSTREQRLDNQKRKFVRSTFLQQNEAEKELEVIRKQEISAIKKAATETITEIEDEVEDESKNKCEAGDETLVKSSNGASHNIFQSLNLKNDNRSAIFQTKKVYQMHKLENAPETEVEITRLEAVKMYRDMQVIRGLERAANKMYLEKVIRGFCHLYTGQEAIAVGMMSEVRPQDNIITAYRCHGWCYAAGISVEAILAELAGKITGVQRGKGGSMHMYNSNFYGGNGIVGAQIPLGVGIALASKYRGDGGVCISCYGDGAANQGQVFEVFNMACLWKLPVIFVCENNMYGMGTSSKRSSCCDDYYTRGDYIPGIWVNGMDIVAVRSATKFAIDYVLKNGPIVLEMHTYRYQGHSMSDPGTSYRSREEIETTRKTADPIQIFRNSLLEKDFLTQEQFQLLDKDVSKEINAASNVARTSKEMDLSELCADVYSNNLEPQIRGTIGWNLRHKQINKGNNAS